MYLPTKNTIFSGVQAAIWIVCYLPTEVIKLITLPLGHRCK